MHESLAPIPQVHVCPCPLSASVSLPVGGTVGELTALSVEVANHSAALQARAAPSRQQRMRACRLTRLRGASRALARAPSALPLRLLRRLR